MDYFPIQNGVEIFLVALCYRHRDDLRPDRPLNWFICTLYLAYNLYFEAATKMNNCFGFYRV